MEKILTGKNIWKSFTGSLSGNAVLKGVDIEIEKGEFACLMGASGSGKSTLLYILSSIDRPDQGDVLFQGTNLSELSAEENADVRRKNFGFVFQQPTLLKNLNLLENIVLPSLYDRKAEKKELIRKAKSLMEKTGIADLGARGTTEVSGGELQRAGICRAVLHSPSLLFADEPTGALDSESGEEVIKLLQAINKEGVTILLVTHDRKVAAAADRILFMKDGSFVEELRLSDLPSGEKEEKILLVAKKCF